MPFGYHSATNPGSAQLEVPTRIRPAIGLNLAPPAEAVPGRHDRAQVVRVLLGAPGAARLDVADLAERHVGPFEAADRRDHDVRHTVALLELAIRRDERLAAHRQPVTLVHGWRD